MDSFDDWFMVPPMSSFQDLTNNSRTERVEEICINADDKENVSESSPSKNESSSSIPVINGEEVKKISSCALPHHEKGDSVKIIASSSKKLWVGGLTEKTTANDLKALFSKYGKVSGAKILQNVKTPSTCCGLITMTSSEEALACIEKLNQAELHGPIITVEKTTTTIEPSGSIKQSDLKSMQSEAPPTESEKSTESSKDVTSIPSQLPNLVTNTARTQCSRSQLLNESSQKFSQTCHLKTEKMPRKQDVLQQIVDVSTNTEVKDTSNTDFSGTSDQKKLDKNTGGFRLLGIRKARNKDRFAYYPFLPREDIFGVLCCLFLVPFMMSNLADILPKPADVTSLNNTITALQRENFLLKRQIFYNQRKENRKLTSLSNLVSIKFEEKENVTRKYLEQLELEALYLEKINSLKEEVSSLEAKYKMLQNHFTEGSSIVEEAGEKHEEIPGLSSNSEKCNNAKCKSHEPLTHIIFFLSFTFFMLLILAKK